MPFYIRGIECWGGGGSTGGGTFTGGSGREGNKRDSQDGGKRKKLGKFCNIAYYFAIKKAQRGGDLACPAVAFRFF